MVISPQVQMKRKRCLIVAPNTSHVVTAIYNGLLEGLSSSFDKRDSREESFVLSTEAAIGTRDDKKFYERMKEKIISKKFDVIFTLGKNCSMMLQEVTMQQRIFTPIVFSAVLNPHTAGLTISGYQRYHHITGVSSEVRDYGEQIDALYAVGKGIVKTVVLLKSRLGMQYIEEEVIKARQLLELKGFHVREVIIEDTNASWHDFAASLAGADLVFIPRETEVTKYIIDIVSICNSQRVPIYASDRESVNLGAALGFGVEESIIGTEAAEKALPILLDGKAPSTIPVEPMKNWNPCIILNMAALHNQAGVLKDPLKKLFDYKNIEMISS